MNQANNLGDDILVTDLQDQAKLLQQKFFNFQKNFMWENINSYISALILEGFTVSKTLPIDSLKLFYNGLTQRIKKTSSGNNIESILFPLVMPTDVGQLAPMFSGPNPKGEILGWLPPSRIPHGKSGSRYNLGNPRRIRRPPRGHQVVEERG